MSSRQEALALLDSVGELRYADLDTIFAAFGFRSHAPTWDTEVYYHPTWPNCGAFTARDDRGFGTLTARQRDLVRGMIECVTFSEQYSERPLQQDKDI